MSDNKKHTDAEEILSEFQQTQRPESVTPETSDEPAVEPETQTPDSQIPQEPSDAQIEPAESVQPEPTAQLKQAEDPHERNVIFVGTKPIMTYVTATLTQLAGQPTVTIKARGKRITQAADVSQMIVKRMDAVGYVISDVRIASDSLTSQDGRQRNVSTIEIDVTKN